MRKSTISLFALILIVIILTSLCFLGDSIYAGPTDDEVTQLIQSAPTAQMYPDAGILNILDENVVEVFEDGRCKETLHVVFRVLNDRGKDDSDIAIGYDSRTQTASIVYAKTITQEGKIIPLNENAIQIVTPYSEYPSYSDYKELTFSMPGVSVGSIIDYKVVKEEKNPEIKGKFSDRFYFQMYEPTYLCRYKVIAPEGIDLKYLVLNPLQGIEVSPKVIRDRNKKTYLWEYKYIPQIIKEKSMPPVEEIAFRILVTTMNSWEEFFDWWGKKIEKKTEPDEAILKKVGELTKDLSSPKEKMEVIFDYVKREIRYVSIDFGKSGYEPEAAKKVFENKYGDCKDKSTLLISMLRTAGISAYYVLIPTSEIGNLIKDFPYPFQFDHCIVVVTSENKYYFLDPVAEDYRFDNLPGNDRDRDVLIVKDEKAVFAKTPSAEPEENASYTQQKITIGLDGSIEAEVKDSGLGRREASLRSFFIDNRPTKVRESLEKRVDDISSGAKLLTYSHTNPLNFKERFELRIKYYAQDYCKKAGGILIFDVPEIWRSCPATGKKERRYPVVILNNSYSKEEAEFTVPEGYEVYHLPEPLEIKNRYFEFRSSYRQDGDKILYQEELIRKALRITPEEYDAYKNCCFGMEKSFNRSVLFIGKKSIAGKQEHQAAQAHTEHKTE
jgi:transglutaminase-like putative cysteine protease